MSNSGLREKLADLAHKQWSGWMRWMIHCLESPDRETHLARWKRQMETPYADLPETEKESDRREADKVLAALEASKCHHGEVLDCHECDWERKHPPCPHGVHHPHECRDCLDDLEAEAARYRKPGETLVEVYARMDAALEASRRTSKG